MTDYDSPWKEALELFLNAFLRFFFPDVHADIDNLRTSSIVSRRNDKCHT